MKQNKQNYQIKIAYSEEYVAKLPDGHKFPIMKYKMIPEKLLSEGIIKKEHIFAPSSATPEIVELTHAKEYVKKVIERKLTEQEIRRIGFPLTEEFVKREFIIAQGTINAALWASENLIAFNCAGGTHHAFSGKGAAFCIFNDVAVATNYLLSQKIKQKILIIDLDVHQGNGTAGIFKNNKNVFTFSIHCAKSWPPKKEISDLDIELEPGTGDNEYLEILDKNLSSIIKCFNPDFAFYIAGADVIKSDKWGGFNLSVNGTALRDRMVFQQCLSGKIPVAVTMGGGYSQDINIITEVHCNTFNEGIKLLKNNCVRLT